MSSKNIDFLSPINHETKTNDQIYFSIKNENECTRAQIPNILKHVFFILDSITDIAHPNIFLKSGEKYLKSFTERDL